MLGAIGSSECRLTPSQADTIGAKVTMRFFTPLIATVLLSSCAAGDPVRMPGIEVAEPAAVTSCRYVDTVHGTSSWYGLFAEKGIENARLSAFDKAQKLGATHVVRDAAAQPYGSSQVTAKAYVCRK
jgi:hypothetical protein